MAYTALSNNNNIRRSLLYLLILGMVAFLTVAVYLALEVLPDRQLSLLSYALPGLAALVAILVWKPKLAVPLLIVSVFFSPDIVAAQMSDRNVNLRVDDGILVAALLAVMVRCIVTGEWPDFRTPLDKPILAFCAVALLSTLLGIFFGTVSPLKGGFFFAKRVEYFVLFYLLYHCLEGEKDVKCAIYLVFLCAVGISVYGVYMRMTSGAAQWRGYSPLGGTSRVTEYGEILALIIPIVIAVALEKRSLMHFSALPFAMFCMLYFLMDTLRRSAMVGVAVAVLFLAVYRYRLLLASLPIAIAYFTVRLPEAIAERLQFLWLEITQYPYPGGSLPERVISLQTAMKYWLYKPLLGKGLGAYALDNNVSHNQYSHMLLEIGLVGLASFLWFVASILKLSYRGSQDKVDSLHRGFCMGFLAGISGWLVMNMGTIAFTSIRTMSCFMIVTAILVAYTRLQTMRDVPVAATL